MGPEAAMACTAAVETEIDKHYSEQLKALGDDDPDLAATIAEFQAEELAHSAAAIAAGAENALGYPVLSAFIRSSCRAALALQDWKITRRNSRPKSAASMPPAP